MTLSPLLTCARFLTAASAVNVTSLPSGVLRVTTRVAWSIASTVAVTAISWLLSTFFSSAARAPAPNDRTTARLTHATMLFFIFSSLSMVDLRWVDYPPSGAAVKSLPWRSPRAFAATLPPA